MKNLLFIISLVAIIFTSCKKDDGSIAGTVTYANGGEQVAVKDAVVRLYSVKLANDGTIEGGANQTPIAETKSNEKGEFAFTDMEEGNYWITAVGTIDGVKYGTSPYAPVGVYLPEGQSEKKDIVITKL